MFKEHSEGEGSIDLVRLTAAERSFREFMERFSKLSPSEIEMMVKENRDAVAKLMKGLDTKLQSFE